MNEETFICEKMTLLKTGHKTGLRPKLIRTFVSGQTSRGQLNFGLKQKSETCISVKDSLAQFSVFDVSM